MNFRHKLVLFKGNLTGTAYLETVALQQHVGSANEICLYSWQLPFFVRSVEIFINTDLPQACFPSHAIMASFTVCKSTG